MEVTNNMDAAIQSLRAMMEPIITRATLVEFASAALEADQGQAGYAMLKHAADIHNEDPEATDLDVYCEAYRRTYFDPVAAALYGTEDIAAHCAPRASEMVEHLMIQHQCEQRGLTIHAQPTALPA